MRAIRRLPLLLLLLAGAYLGAGQALAALSPNSVITAQTPNRGLLQFTNASTAGTYATLYTAGANGSVCKGLWVDNSDTGTTHLITVQLVNSGTKYGGATLTTTVSPGTGQFVEQGILNGAVWPGLPTDQNANSYLYLISGDTLQATFATAITASTQVDLHAVCADF
jgi:hypothetical protein